jgi:predicted nucleic acid-binding protein
MLDPNILISATMFPSKKMNTFIDLLANGHHVMLCTYCLEEYLDVMQRKFPSAIRQASIFLLRLPYTILQTPAVDLLDGDVTIRDEDDYPVLMSAILADVDVLITGDKDFSEVAIDRPEIMTPTEFMERYG